MAIPKIIHQTCISPIGLSPELAPFVERVAALHPGWEHRLYGDDESRAAVERIFPALLPLYDASAPIQKADIFRVVAVYGDGGFYLDTDVELRLPLDGLCEFRAVFGEEMTLSPEGAARRGLESPLRIGNYAFGGEPGHPFLLRIMEGMAGEAGRAIAVEDDILESTGPGLVTAVYIKHRMALKDVVILRNYDRMCPMCRAVSCSFGNYAAHAHVGSWRWEGLKGRAAPGDGGPRRDRRRGAGCAVPGDCRPHIRGRQETGRGHSGARYVSRGVSIRRAFNRIHAGIGDRPDGAGYVGDERKEGAGGLHAGFRREETLVREHERHLYDLRIDEDTRKVGAEHKRPLRPLHRPPPICKKDVHRVGGEGADRGDTAGIHPAQAAAGAAARRGERDIQDRVSRRAVSEEEPL
ncbi:MAG: glycosyltransferase [Thermodesulfobacteriota bacterium]